MANMLACATRTYNFLLNVFSSVCVRYTLCSGQRCPLTFSNLFKLLHRHVGVVILFVVGNLFSKPVRRQKGIGGFLATEFHLRHN